MAGGFGEDEVFKENVRLTVEHVEGGVNRRHADRLGEMAFPDAGISEHEDIIVLLDESQVAKFEDQRVVKAGL